ncbi:hypothetical protein HDU93_003322 [Gonapodya sp. JEL0774]|nr:hypothetical protein HDU93_003322 [Gonapodya sp. JEL0774]
MTTDRDESVGRLLQIFEERDDVDARTCIWALKAANGSVDGAANYILLKGPPPRQYKPGKKRMGKGNTSPAKGIDDWIKKDPKDVQQAHGIGTVGLRKLALTAPVSHSPDSAGVSLNPLSSVVIATGDGDEEPSSVTLPNLTSAPPDSPPLIPTHALNISDAGYNPQNGQRTITGDAMGIQPSSSSGVAYGKSFFGTASSTVVSMHRSSLNSLKRTRPEPVALDPPDPPQNSALSLLRWPASTPGSASLFEGPLVKKPRASYPLLLLSTPEAVSTNLPTCTLIRSFLSHDLADPLLLRLMNDSKEWEFGQYIVGERIVTANRKGGFYIEPKIEGNSDTATDELMEDGGAGLRFLAENDLVNKVDGDNSGAVHEESLATPDGTPNRSPTGYPVVDPPSSPAYVYQGRVVRQAVPYPTEMEVARVLVEERVNELSAERQRHPLEAEGRWRATAAVANHYGNGRESVAWHGDRLNHIGPLPTVASLTLGASRAFRLRGIDGGKTYAVVLKHGDLFVMGPGTQVSVFNHKRSPVAILNNVIHLAGTLPTRCATDYILVAPSSPASDVGNVALQPHV